jgi:hypothetical protein
MKRCPAAAPAAAAPDAAVQEITSGQTRLMLANLNVLKRNIAIQTIHSSQPKIKRNNETI